MQNLSCDVCVIGGGSAGLSVAAGAAQLGLNVVLFERGEMGGDCLNSGCVPSKALIAAGAAAQAMRDAQKFGVHAQAPQIDWPAVRAHVRGVIDEIAPIDSQERFEGLGVTVIREHARFADGKTVTSASSRVRAKRFVIATGSTAFVPPIEGLADIPYLTNETIFDIDALPGRLLVLGGGPIGIELGQAFRRLGAEVTIIEAARALGRADEESAAFALGRLRREGVEILEGWKAVRASAAPSGAALTLEGPDKQTRTIEGTHILVAVGRRPILEGLDLEKAGVRYTPKGVETSPTLRTSNPRVWAIGDAAGRELFTHAAGWHASAWVRSALFKAVTRADSQPIPAVTYCDPEVAQLGMTETEARRAFGADAVTTSRWSFTHNDRAVAERDSEGFCKIVTKKNGQILGCSIVGAHAGDLLAEMSLAMSSGLKMRALTSPVIAYPTRAEIIKRAAGAFYTPVLFSSRTKALINILKRIP
ncbi:MAG: dihydrolipoamide dehydrogenase [Alphaproteobacteria bacterium]|nr:dihydrolipoamide dehydrogenase [Alphaproteobacteria bacterium]